MIRAIAFDFDGVLVESVDVKTRAFARLFADEGQKLVERIVAYHLKNGGVSRFDKFRKIYRDILKRPLSEEQFHALCETYANLVVEEVVSVPWVDGAETFIRDNWERFLFFVVSGTPELELKDIIWRRGAEKFFLEVRGSPEIKDVLLRDIMKRHGLSPAEIVFVGDAESDWMAAQKTGIRFIWRQTAHASTKPEGYAGLSIPSLTNLESCLAQIG
jgi:phosphoglycolate phosphatase-like HAD superfamily hydrolase